MHPQCAEAVLADGRLVIAGGEYNRQFLLHQPERDLRSAGKHMDDITPPQEPGFAFIGDSPADVLADGRFVVGDKFKKLMRRSIRKR